MENIFCFYMKNSYPYTGQQMYVRRLSGKFEDTVNTEAKTSNNMELFLLVLLRAIKQFIYEFSFQSVNS